MVSDVIGIGYPLEGRNEQFLPNPIDYSANLFPKGYPLVSPWELDV